MSTMVVALLREVFFGDESDGRLGRLLAEARQKGAELVVLPELAHLPWRPAFREAVRGDAEPLRGRTFERLSKAARFEAVAVLGGAIVVDEANGQRYNTALLLDQYGELVASYRKLHLPDEPGFYEADHYAPGDGIPRVVEQFPLRLGVQICSDVNRPEGSHILAAMGAEVLLCPRATEARTFPRWRTVLTANAITSSCYVLSVPRPRPEFDVPLGGTSIAIAPDGTVLGESEETLMLVELERTCVERARVSYPGYLAVRSELYARGWAEVVPAPQPGGEGFGSDT